MGYIILYGLTLFNISPEELLQAEIPEKDIAVIKKVKLFSDKLYLISNDWFLKAKNFLNTIYVRHLKHKVGWKKASHQIFNQRYIMDQMNEVMIIHTMENLQLSSDLSNSQILDPTKVTANHSARS